MTGYFTRIQDTCLLSRASSESCSHDFLHSKMRSYLQRRLFALHEESLVSRTEIMDKVVLSGSVGVRRTRCYVVMLSWQLLMCGWRGIEGLFKSFGSLTRLHIQHLYGLGPLGLSRITRLGKYNEIG